MSAMDDTEPTTTEDADATIPSAARTWTRRPDHRWIAGVASGIADGADVPVWVVRVGFVLGAFLGTVGFWAYLFLWWLMPRRDLAESAAHRTARRFPQAPVWLGIGLLALGVFLFAGQLGWVNPPLIVALVLIAIGVLLFVRDAEAETVVRGGVGAVAIAPAPTPPPPTAPPTGPGTALPPASLPAAARPRRRRQPSFLGPLTLGVGLLVIGLGAVLDLAGAVSFTFAQASALLLLILGIGLAIGGFVGRARWLVIPVLVLAPFALVTSVLHIDLDDGIGGRTVTVRDPSGPVVARVGAGALTVDLSRVAFGEDVTVTAAVGAGVLTLNVPDDATVLLDGEVGLGTTEDLYSRIGANGVFRCCESHVAVWGFGEPVRWNPRHAPDPEGGVIWINADVSFGSVRINHVTRTALR
jgi:phage shock protein PspC (stress-responsive transcriptional regulator)